VAHSIAISKTKIKSNKSIYKKSLKLLKKHRFGDRNIRKYITAPQFGGKNYALRHKRH